jgi:hypothetical protein
VSLLFDSVPALEALKRAATGAHADLSSLRTCLTGGTLVPAALVEAFSRLGLCLRPATG